MTKTVQFTKQSVKSFIKEYNKARKSSATEFIFEDNEYLTDYAYYLIEYFIIEKSVKGKFNKDKIFTTK